MTTQPVPNPADPNASCAPEPMRLSGLEPVNIDANSLFVNIGERTNITGSLSLIHI